MYENFLNHIPPPFFSQVIGGNLVEHPGMLSGVLNPFPMTTKSPTQHFFLFQPILNAA